MSTNVLPANRANRAYVSVHPLLVRIWHWINAVAIIIMIMSGWRIYNAAPVFHVDFRFPPELTLGGWLGGALQWHYAAMWLLVTNFLVFLIYGVLSGHFREKFLPITVTELLHDVGEALRLKLSHEDITVYNAVQRLAYVGVLTAIAMTIFGGIAMWKPVQFHGLAWLMGGYDGARVVHFIGMSVIVAFIIVHLALVLLVPSTFLPMITGTAPTGDNDDTKTEGQRT